jgi:ubiquinone/menaquinone biosynthesis C-methylase UbiE
VTKTEDAVAAYWNERIHDLEMTDEPVGSPGFFRDLAEYRFDKLKYLQQVVDFGAYGGKRVLEVGCGLGLDLMLFARGGAQCTGIDLSAQAIGLAGTYFEGEGVEAEFTVMDGAAMEYEDDTFDLVYVHGVLPYAADAAAIARDCHRVLKPGGSAIFMNYNSRSWLSFLSRFAKVGLEHDDAPVFRPRTRAELAAILEPFDDVRIMGERFPVKSRLHKGVKGALFNGVFVPAFKILPKALVRRWGWHWMAYCRKASSSS